MAGSGKSSGTKRPWIALWLLVGIAALAVCGWLLLREPQLTDHAERITNVTRYAWIDDHQLVWAMPGQGNLARIDLKTRKQTLLEAGSKAGAGAPIAAQSVRVVGPDGKRILAGTLENDSGSPYAEPVQHALELDLDGRIKREMQPQSSVVWLPDGRRWLGLEPVDRYSSPGQSERPTSTLWLYSADSPGRRIGPVPASRYAAALLAVTPQYRLLYSDMQDDAVNPEVTIWQQGIYTNTEPRREFHCNAPSDWLYRACVVSPSGERVAWLLSSVRVPPLLLKLHKLAPWLVKKPDPTVSFLIRTTRIDGSDAHEVGYQRIAMNGDNITALRWVPGEKRLSFAFRDSLYIVPAE